MAGILGAGGEEWQNFEQPTGYDPAAWTQSVRSAAARIDELRCREVELILVDADHRPVPHRRFAVEQTRSAFDWGFCGWSLMRQLHDGTFHHYENRHQRGLRQQLFNSINLMHYWAETHCTNAPVTEEYPGEVDYETLEAGVNWARGQGLKAKGHPLYWGVPKAIPPWLLRYDLATRRRFQEVRIRQITARFKGRISIYDAQNEMLWEPTLGHITQRHWPHIESLEDIAEENALVLGWARNEDPDACYLLNEYGVCRGECEPVPVPTNRGGAISRDQQLDRYIALAGLLRARGQAPDALGIQCPPGSWQHLTRLVDTLDDLGGQTGLPVHITEFRTGLKHLEKAGLGEDEIQQRLGEYLEALLTICFGNRHCEAFWFWGDSYLANPNGRRASRAFELLDELLNRRWRTRIENLRSDAEGIVRFRGFCGEYRLRHHQGEAQDGQLSSQAFSLPVETQGCLQLRLRLRGL